MRAFDIFIFCICLNLGIGLVNYVMTTEGEKAYMPEQQGQGWHYNVSDVSGMGVNETSPISSALALTQWVIGGMLFIINLLVSIVWIYPALADTFGIPAPISVVLQTLIYIIYAVAIAQILMKIDLRAFQ